LKLEVDSLDGLQAIINVQPRVLVVFTQPSTCAPCRAMKPQLDRFADKHTEPTVVVVDLDIVPDAVVEYGLRSVPTLKLYKNGRYAQEVSGRTVVQLEKELSN
jgi:thioredoxin 1